MLYMYLFRWGGEVLDLIFALQDREMRGLGALPSGLSPVPTQC